MTTHRSNMKEILLDATETIVLNKGVVALTFDAVAKEAGVSKGGVLHHFGSKDLLIEAVVIRGVNRWRSFYMALYENMPSGPGRMSRALLHNGFLDPDSWTEHYRSNFSVLMAVVVQVPSMRCHIREAYSELYTYLREDGLVPGISELIGSVFDGVWLNWALGFSDLDYAMLNRVQTHLARLLPEPADSH